MYQDAVFSAAYSGTRAPFCPTAFLHTWWRHADSLAGYQQQDAHEFYLYALSGLGKAAAAGSPSRSLSPPLPLPGAFSKRRTGVRPFLAALSD